MGTAVDNQWLFNESKPGGWVWRCVDKSTGSVLRVAKREFRLLYECVEDAKQNGFTPSPTALPPNAEDNQQHQDV